MLEVNDLHGFYGAAHVIQGVSLAVPASSVVALLGRNGAGKTTLIRAIMGMSPPQARAAVITWQGQSLAGLRPHQIAARRIAIVPQGRRLFASLTVAEHLNLRRRQRESTWTPARALELFPRLAERRNHRGSQLSGGERQMLAIARAL